MSICLDPTHLVTGLLINFPQLLSLVTFLISSLYNLLVFAVPCGFVAICWFAVVRLLSCPACQFVFPLRGCFIYYLLIKSQFSSCNWVLALLHYRLLTERIHHHEDSAEEGLAPSATSFHTVQPSLPAHSPVQGPELPPSAGH